MSTVKVILKKSNGEYRVNEQGLSLIYVQYGHHSKTVLFPTGIRVDPKHWKGDKDQNNTISRAQRGYSSNNAVVQKKKQQVEETKNNLILQDTEPTIETVREEMNKGKAKRIQREENLLKLFDQYIKSIEPIRANNTVKKFRTSYNHLKDYLEFKKIKFQASAVTLDFYNGYVNHLLTKKNMVNNSVGATIKNLKVFLKDLEKRGYAFKVKLSEYKVMEENPNVIFLTQAELTKLEKYDFRKRPGLERVRDIFVLGCYTGLRYSDISRLAKEHIKGNTIKMRAHKNKKMVTIPLAPKVFEVLEKYNYKLPILSGQKFNEYIKDACELAKIDSPTEEVIYKGGQKTYVKRPKWELISSHKAVSTFISLCGANGIQAKVVSEITGKSVGIIMKHYYGVDEGTIEKEMSRAFGNPSLKIDRK